MKLKKLSGLFLIFGCLSASSGQAAYVKCSGFRVCTKLTNLSGMTDGQCYSNVYKTLKDCQENKTAMYWKGQSVEEVEKKLGQ